METENQTRTPNTSDKMTICIPLNDMDDIPYPTNRAPVIRHVSIVDMTRVVRCMVDVPTDERPRHAPSVCKKSYDDAQRTEYPGTVGNQIAGAVQRRIKRHCHRMRTGRYNH